MPATPQSATGQAAAVSRASWPPSRSEQQDNGNFAGNESSGFGVYENLRGLINVVDELRDIGLQQYINLPRIVVVGTQSAGKSSVLEGIVGLDFLPRGDGVVTRRPLELRLVHDASATKTTAKFDPGVITPNCTAQPPTNKIFDDMKLVCREIERLTDSVAGINKGIVDDPIILTIVGSQCPDLTLVDLPGITRVPLKDSDQTDDIETLTREMSKRYVEDPRTIILAVIPANQDISTSDALQLARKVDPKGLRTIGVITKLDLMDLGTNASRMILGEDIPLRLGYIAVKNRNQAEIVSEKSVRKCVQDEMSYFREHPVYKVMPQSHFGMKNLIEKLTKVLFRHLHKFLPQIKNQIITKQRELQQRARELGDHVPTEPAQRTQLIWSMLNDYCELFSNVIRGKYEKRLSSFLDHETNSMYGGSQIRSTFCNLLSSYLPPKQNQQSALAANAGAVTNPGSVQQQQMTAAAVAPPCIIDLNDMEIDQAIRMHEGDSLPGFPTPDTFVYLILPHLQKLSFPVMECLDEVAYTLDQLMQHLSVRVFSRFPQLGAEVLQMSRALLENHKEKTREILDNLVNAETGYMFTNDESYLAAHGAMLSTSTAASGSQEQLIQHAGGSNTPGAPHGARQSWFNGAKETTFAHVQNGLNMFRLNNNAAGNASDFGAPHYSGQFLAEIRGRLNAYFSIVLRNIRDTAPKTIGHFLVRRIQETLQFELYSSISSRDMQSQLLGEPEEIVEERASIKKQLAVLAQASSVLQRDPMINAFTGAASSGEFDDQFDWDLRNAGKEYNDTQAAINTAVPYAPPYQQPIPTPPVPSQPAAASQATGGGFTMPGASAFQKMKMSINLNDRSAALFENKKIAPHAPTNLSNLRANDPLFDS